MLYLGLFCNITSRMCPKVTAFLLYTTLAYEKVSQESPTCIGSQFQSLDPSFKLT